MKSKISRRGRIKWKHCVNVRAQFIQWSFLSFRLFVFSSFLRFFFHSMSSNLSIQFCSFFLHSHSSLCCPFASLNFFYYFDFVPVCRLSYHLGDKVCVHMKLMATIVLSLGSVDVVGRKQAINLLSVVFGTKLLVCTIHRRRCLKFNDTVDWLEHMGKFFAHAKLFSAKCKKSTLSNFEVTAIHLALCRFWK